MTAQTPIVSAIRQKCLDCCSGSRKYIRYCSSDGVHSSACSLWPYRFGLRPDAARKRCGPALLDPNAMPDPNGNLDDLP